MPEQQNPLNVTFNDLQSFIDFYRYWNNTYSTRPVGFDGNVLSKVIFTGSNSSDWRVSFDLPSTFVKSVTFNNGVSFTSVTPPTMKQLELNDSSGNPYVQFTKTNVIDNYYIQRYD